MLPASSEDQKSLCWPLHALNVLFVGFATFFTLRHLAYLYHWGLLCVDCAPFCHWRTQVLRLVSFDIQVVCLTRLASEVTFAYYFPYFKHHQSNWKHFRLFQQISSHFPAIYRIAMTRGLSNHQPFSFALDRLRYLRPWSQSWFGWLWQICLFQEYVLALDWSHRILNHSWYLATCILMVVVS